MKFFDVFPECDPRAWWAVFVFILCVGALVMPIVQCCTPVVQSKKEMASAAKRGSGIDVWGNAFIIREVDRDDTHKTIRVISCGPDGNLDTDDDIVHDRRICVNKTKAAGQYVGKKSKTFIKGLIKGVFSKDEGSE